MNFDVASIIPAPIINLKLPVKINTIIAVAVLAITRQLIDFTKVLNCLSFMIITSKNKSHKWFLKCSKKQL